MVWCVSASYALAIALLQVMDYGYPQFTEAQILQEFIKTDSYRMEVRVHACYWYCKALQLLIISNHAHQRTSAC